MKKEIELKPIREATEDYAKIEKKIIELFRREIYLPLIKEFSRDKILRNSLDDLVWAILSGSITFDRGVFSGKFKATSSAELRALGATWDRKKAQWRISKANLPGTVQSAISQSEFRFRDKIAAIDRRLADISPEALAGKLNVVDHFDTALWKVDKDFRTSVRSITVAPELSDEARMRIAMEWQHNLDLYISDFTSERTSKLREELQKSIFAGNRYEYAIKTIQKDYGVTLRKAEFLAHQETNLLMAKHKEVRYQEAGVHEYRWRCLKMPHDSSPDVHTPGYVRYYHGKLDGTKQRFDSPPITDGSGRRNNPGEDYNCRCTAVPVVRLD